MPHRLGRAAFALLVCSTLLACTALLPRAAQAAALECQALPAPSKGVRLVYYAPLPLKIGVYKAVTPTWYAATRTATLSLGTLAVFTCSNSTRHQLLVGNRTQPTGTFNRTCTALTSLAATFEPSPPTTAAVTCQPASQTTVIAWPTKCGQGQIACGTQSCCSSGDACMHEGLQGYGLCCPKGSKPCGGVLCCTAGETCLSTESNEYGRPSAKCCGKGTTPCGTGSCCRSGERCHPTINGGAGLCCPGGEGYTPCLCRQPYDLDVTDMSSCCSPGTICTSSVKKQEQPSICDGSFNSCCPSGSACGGQCCKPYEKCTSPFPDYYQCVTDKEAAASKDLNLTECGSSGAMCPKGQCTPAGFCCPGLRMACGQSTCCGQHEHCTASAYGGMGRCCPEGTQCGDDCCAKGEVCNPVAAALGAPGGRPCCAAGTKPCGSSECCSSGTTCWPKANAGRGLCCPKGGTMECGAVDCCAANTTCVKTKWAPSGMCCGGEGMVACGASECCSTPGQKCVEGKCVAVCPKSMMVCGGGCCDGECCGEMCCMWGASCCGNTTCCQPGTRCCGDTCCKPSDKCQLSPHGEGEGNTTKLHGTCVALGSGCSGAACGGVCCAQGQVCSADGLKCCSPRDVSCLVSGEAPVVQCGAAMSAGSKTCGLWKESCFWPASNGSAACCSGGALPCTGGGAGGKCCPAGALCGASLVAYYSSSSPVGNCCPNGSLPCGYNCCDGKREWCHSWLFMTDGDDSGQAPPACFPRSWVPCGRTACPSNQTCFASARHGWGLCCDPGAKLCMSADREGRMDWWKCC